MNSNPERSDNLTTADLAAASETAALERADGNYQVVTRNMDAANIAGWAAQNHFLVVEIVDRAMRITPVSFEPVMVKDSHGKPIQLPLVVQLP